MSHHYSALEPGVIHVNTTFHAKRQKAKPPQQNLSNLRQTLPLAEKMGALLGSSPVLQPKLQAQPRQTIHQPRTLRPNLNRFRTQMLCKHP